MKFFNRITLVLAFILIFFSSVFLVNSIRYAFENDVFVLAEVSASYDKNYESSVDLNIVNLIPGKVDYEIEVVYLEQNLVVGHSNEVCKKFCSIDVFLDKTYFGDFEVIVTTFYKGKAYREVQRFSLVYKNLNYQIEIPSIIELDPEVGVVVTGLINSDSTEEINYTFEIFPRTAVENSLTFYKACSGSCSFEFILDSGILIDNYLVNVYSVRGDVQKRFKVNLPYSIPGSIPKGTDKNSEKFKKFSKYFVDSSTDDISEYFFYNNFSKEGVGFNSKIIDRKSKKRKSKSNVSIDELVDLEFDVINSTVKRITVPNARVGNVSIGFEPVSVSNVTHFDNAVNAFAIDPRMNVEATEFNLTFVAQSDKLYKCKDYFFDTQTCFGNYVFVMDTVPGVEYTITLTPEDPIFVEIPQDYYEVHSGTLNSGLASFTDSISIVNSSNAFVKMLSRSTDSTPDDWQVTPYILNESTVGFDRYSSTTAVDVSWQVIEGNKFNVQSGISSLGIGVNSTSITISSVNLSSTFAIVYGRCADSTTGDSRAGYFYGNITNSTNIDLVRGSGAVCAGTVRWQVIDWDGANVQKGSLLLSDTGISITDPINSVNLSRSFIEFGWAGIGSDQGMDSNLVRGSFSSDTLIRFDRDGGYTSTSDREIVYYVVEHPDIEVDYYSTAYSSSGILPITAVSNLSRTFYSSSIEGTGGGQTYRNMHYTLNLSSSTTLDYTKQTTSQTNTMNTFIIEFFPEVVLVDPNEVQLNSSSGFDIDTDNLTCNYILDSSVRNVFVNWFVDSTSMMKLALPFEGGLTDSLLDFSNNSNNATNNGATWNVSGGFDGNGSYSFDGVSNNLNVSSMSWPSSGGPVTVSFWNYVASVDVKNSNSFTIGNQDNPNRFQSNSPWSDNVLYWDYGNISNGGRISTSYLSYLDKWTYVTLVSEGNGGNFKAIYLDGVQIVNDSGPSDGPDTLLSGALIGTGLNNFHKGEIDDFRVYDRVLSSSQISELYSGNQDLIVSDEISGYETWMCSVVGFDTVRSGLEYFSNLVYMSSTAVPGVSGLSLSAETPNAYVDENLTCSYTEIGSTTTSSIVWLLDGASILKASYPFEGGLSNSIFDVSGNGNNLTSNSVVYSSSGGFNSTAGYRFNSISGQYLDLGSDPSIFYDGNSNYTFSFYINTNQVDNNVVLMADKDWSFSIYNGYAIFLDSGVCNLNIGDGFNWINLNGGISVNDGNWHQCTFVLNDSGNASLYVDGVFDSGKSMTSINDVNSTLPTVIGNDGTKNFGGSLFNGSIDNVQIYDRALSSEQVLNLYNSSNVLSYKETLGGDAWQCRVFPFDNFLIGDNQTSNSMTISNLPSVTSITLNQPLTDLEVYNSAQYDFIFNLSCADFGACDNVNVTLKYEYPESIGETGSVTLSNNEQFLIEFQGSYNQTPVFIGVPASDTNNDNNSLVPIVHSINKTHALVSLCEDAGATTCSTTVESETLHYYIFDVDKANAYSWIDVGYVNSVITDGGNNIVSFSKTFLNAPYVFAQSQTYGGTLNEIGSHAWAHSISTTGATLIGCDHPGVGDVCAGSFIENFSYVAIDTLNSDFQKMSSGSVSVSNSEWNKVSFSYNYTDAIMMVLQNSDVGSQDPEYPWAGSVTSSGADVRYCEQDGAGVCNSHSAETVVWFALESGLITLNSLVTDVVPTDSNSLYTYISTGGNPKNYSLNSNSWTYASFPIYFTGPQDTILTFFAELDNGSRSDSFNATIGPSSMEVNISSPINDSALVGNTTFEISGNVTCLGFCGEVFSKPRYNGTEISNVSGTLPFYVIGDVNLSCNPGISGGCNFTWLVNVTGDLGTDYLIDIWYNSSVFGVYNTEDRFVQVVAGPEVRFVENSLNISDAIASYQSGSVVGTVDILLSNHTNVQVSCSLGNCSFFSHNFSNGINMTLGNPVDISFTCLPNKAGDFWAEFFVSSSEDLSGDTINVSCSSTELDLYVLLNSPSSINSYDIRQNLTFNMTFNVTCKTVGGCNNTELGVYYERESIGEVGSVTTSNFNEENIVFMNTYNSIPVVVAVAATDTNSDNNGLLPVIYDITTTGFKLKLCEDAGASTCSSIVESETVHYYVFDVDKANAYSWIDVGYVNSVNSNGVANAFSFNKTFSVAPYVFAWSQTDSDGGSSMAPTAWTTTISTTGANLFACDHPGIADVCAGSTTEKYGYVAIDMTNQNIGEFDFGSASISNSAWTGVSFTNTFTNPIMMVAQNSEVGGQDPQYPWADSVTSLGANVRYCEQDAAGVCDTHSAETIVWMALEDGSINVGNISSSAVSTLIGTAPYFTYSSNPQNFTMLENTSEFRSFLINTSDVIDATNYIYGLLGNGVGSEILEIRTIGFNELSFQDIALNFSLVYQDDGVGVVSTTLDSRYENDNITISCQLGDCSNITTTWVDGTNLVELGSSNVNFICSDSNVGTYSALFNVSSNNSEITNTINLSCQVDAKVLDIDLIDPSPETTFESIIYNTVNLTFNVTCQNVSGCNNVNVYANYIDDNRSWWNRSWEYRQNITMSSTVASSFNYTFEVKLNSTNVGKKFDWSLSCNDLRFIYNDYYELDFWIEKCDFANKIAEIWIKSTVPLSNGLSYNFSMYYGNINASSTSNGSNVFVFFDDFESYTGTLDGVTPPGWVDYSSGTVQLYSDGSNRALIKTTGADDPSGGFASFTKSVTDFEVMLLTNRINSVGGSANRYSVSNSTTYGYGLYTANYGSTTSFLIENRTAGTGATIATGSTFSTTFGTWYQKVFRKVGTNLNYTIYDLDGNLLNSLSTVDSSLSSFDRFYIHGGREFLTDDVAVREVVSVEPVVSFSQAETSFTPIPVLNTSGIFVVGSNIKTINLLNLETQSVSFLLNTTTPLNSSYEVIGSLDDWDHTKYTTIKIIDLPTSINLSLGVDKVRLDNNLYSYNISFKNLAANHSPRFKDLLVYVFISNSSALDSSFVYLTSGRYSVILSNETLMDGMIYNFNLESNSTLYSTVFNEYLGSYNENNSWNLLFNVTENQSAVGQNSVLVGFDPVFSDRGFGNGDVGVEIRDGGMENVKGVLEFILFHLNKLQSFINVYFGGILG